MKNKKAIGSIVIPLFFTIIMIVLIGVIISYASYKIGDKKTKIYDAERVYINSQEDMLRYLNYPVYYQNNQLTIKDLIIIDYYNYLITNKKEEFSNLNIKNFLDSRSTKASYKFSIRSTKENNFAQIYNVKSNDFPKDKIVELFTTTLFFENNYLVISYEESYDE